MRCQCVSFTKEPRPSKPGKICQSRRRFWSAGIFSWRLMGIQDRRMGCSLTVWRLLGPQLDCGSPRLALRWHKRRWMGPQFNMLSLHCRGNFHSPWSRFNCLYLPASTIYISGSDHTSYLPASTLTVEGPVETSISTVFGPTLKPAAPTTVFITRNGPGWNRTITQEVIDVTTTTQREVSTIYNEETATVTSFVTRPGKI
jgi:hypothetical protein